MTSAPSSWWLRLFANVTVEEQVPTPDRQRVSVRMSAQEKSMAQLQVLAAGPIAEEIGKDAGPAAAGATLGGGSSTPPASGRGEATADQMRPLTDREKRTIRFGAIGIAIFSRVALSGLQVWKFFEKKRVDYLGPMPWKRELLRQQVQPYPGPGAHRAKIDG